MCLNRVERAESLCIVQSFSPCLFQQGDLPGPKLFLQFWQGKLTYAQHQEAWAKELKRKKQSDTDWPRDMPLFCRGCSDANDTDTRVPLKQFPTLGKRDLFRTVIAQGMERFCNGCRESNRLAIGAEQNLADNMESVAEPQSDYIVCTNVTRS